MSNDRVHIKCEGCGAWKMLLSHNGAGLTTADNGILKWLDAHGGCHPHAFDVGLEGNPGFTLHTDDDVGRELEFDKANTVPQNKPPA